MNILLDTHIALWAIADDSRLPGRARALISEPDNTIWVSAASLWEIAIKHMLGRGDMPVSSKDALGYFQQAGYRLLSIEPEHTIAVESLPPVHQDPFDRLLLAQSRTEPLHLLTADALLARYGEWVIRV